MPLHASDEYPGSTLHIDLEPHYSSQSNRDIGQRLTVENTARVYIDHTDGVPFTKSEAHKVRKLI